MTYIQESIVPKKINIGSKNRGFYIDVNLAQGIIYLYSLPNQFSNCTNFRFYNFSMISTSSISAKIICVKIRGNLNCRNLGTKCCSGLQTLSQVSKQLKTFLPLYSSYLLSGKSFLILQYSLPKTPTRFAQVNYRTFPIMRTWPIYLETFYICCKLLLLFLLREYGTDATRRKPVQYRVSTFFVVLINFSIACRRMLEHKIHSLDNIVKIF